MIDSSIPQNLKDQIRRELEIGESIVWSGMPIRRFFTPAATATFIFGIPWTAFAVFWTIGAGIGTLFTSNGFSLFSFFPLFGIPFVLIGLGMLSAPLAAYKKSGKTAYVITDRRAITFEGGSSTVVRSYPPEKLRDIYRSEKRNGSGDVIIKLHAWRDSDGDKSTQELGFHGVQDVRKVESLLKKLAARAPQTATRLDRVPDQTPQRIYPNVLN